MRIDSRKYSDPDSSDFHIPPGEYLCEIVGIATGFDTKNPAPEECWKVGGEIVEGEHSDKKWEDQWIFNSTNPDIKKRQSTQKRQVLIQHRVGGFPKEYEGEITPEDFIGKEVYVTFYDNLYNGKMYHKVTFYGYRALESKQQALELKQQEGYIGEGTDLPENSIPF